MGELTQRSLAQELVVDAGRYALAMTLPMSPAVAVELALPITLSWKRCIRTPAMKVTWPA